MADSKKLADLDLKVKEKELLAKMRGEKDLTIIEVAETLDISENSARITMRNWDRKGYVNIKYRSGGNNLFLPGKKIDLSLSTKT